jgi:hypothetical protein
MGRIDMEKQLRLFEEENSYFTIWATLPRKIRQEIHEMLAEIVIRSCISSGGESEEHEE